MAKFVPLTGCQKELWLSAKAALSDYAETSIRGCYHIDTMLDPELLRQAIRWTLHFTPLPAASLCQDEEEPRFIVGEPHEPDFRVLDAASQPDPAAAADRMIDEFFEEPVENPLMRYALVLTGPSTCIVAMKCSHVVLDGLAFFFHIAVIADVYTALARGETPNLGEPCPCDEAYLEDQAHCASPRFQKDMAFWKDHLARLPEKRLLRALPGRPDVLGESRHQKYVLSEKASRETSALIAAHKVSPAVFFTGIYSLIVSFMSGEKDIVALAPVAYGERKVLYRRQGAMMALPPLLVNVAAHTTFAKLLEAVSAQNGSFYRHVRTPYQLAARKLEGRNFAFLADTFVNFLPNTPPGTPEFPIVEAEQRHSAKEPILFGTLVMQEPRTGCFSLTVRNSRNHLSDRDVERFVARVESVVAQLAAGVEPPKLDFLLDEEKQELARWRNGPARKYDIRSLPELFDATAEKFAARTAVKDEWGNALTYAQLRENSLRYAAWLAGQGVGRGSIVAVAARRTANLPEVVLGIQRLGAVYLPIDPKAAPDRLAYIVEDAGASLTIDLDDHAYRQTPMIPLPQPPLPTEGAYLIYTSGSTGKPKGVLAPHGGFANMIQGQIELFGVQEDDRVVQFAPPIFDASLSEMFMALLAGAGLYPVSDQCRNAPWTLRQYMIDNDISIATLPPSYLNLFEGEPFSGLRVLITAGEPPVAADALHYAKSLRYFNAYGPTETCVCAAMKEVSPFEPQPIGVGRPIPNVTLSIRNAEGRELPAGMPGELWIGGASVALGYHNKPEMTEQRFVCLPQEGGARFYASGDLALWSARGEILLLGRADDQVKIRGNRVELAEVACLLENCEAVSQAAVLAVKDAGGQASLAAFFVLKPGATIESVVAWSRGSLPPYMVPSAWHVLESMPAAPTGKIDRKVLQNIARQGDTPHSGGRQVDAGLVDIFERVLGRTYDPAKSFFDQGGNSLNAMSLLHAIRKTYNVDISFRSFVSCETLFDVEALLGNGRVELTSAALETAPLSMGQFRIWAYQQVNEGSIDYNMPLLLELRGERTADFLEGLRRAANAQELFHCTVAGDIDDPHFLRGKGEVYLRSVAFADEHEAAAFFDEQIHTPFDLRAELPVRLVAATLPRCVQVLVLVHHVAGDGETLEVLLQNALRHLRGEPLVRGMLATQDSFCRRQTAYAASPACADDAAYWQSVLTPTVEPVNQAAGAALRTGAMTAIDIDAVTAQGFETLAKNSGASVLACFVALAGRTLCRRFGRKELLLGVPMGLRETQDEFCAAGFYVNTVPLRIKLEEQEDSAAVADAARQMRQAIEHSRYGAADIVPEFLATHAHFEPVPAPGLEVHRLGLQLRASKLTASFTLVTGAASRIVLEYDSGGVADAQALLQELAQSMRRACEGLARRNPRQVLADAWREILHPGSTVAVADESDFFRDGGDSIKAIQITGILRRSGITTLSAPEFLRKPRFADICALLESGAEAPAAATHVDYTPVAPGERVPLLPFAHHFIETHPQHWQQFFMLLPLEIREDVPTTTLEAWLQALPDNHESLRMAFVPDHATMLAEPQKIGLDCWDFDESVGQTAMLREAVASITAGLNPESGHTLGAALLRQGGRRILVLTGHHLALDALSLEALRQELAHYCRTGIALREAQGLALRAREVERLVAAGVFPTAEQRTLWHAACATPAEPLCALLAQGKDKAAERASAVARLEGFRQEYSPDAKADLLAALACALHAQGQRAAVRITLESHGRDELLPGFDASRSLGWFTAVCPMPLEPAATCAQAREAVGPWLAQHFTPENCNAYGYLRKSDAESFDYAGQIAFNYLGRMIGQPGDEATLVLSALAPGLIPELVHSHMQAEAPLELSVYFDQQGTLHLGAWFSPACLPQSWVDGLLASWLDALKTLPAYLPQQTLDAIFAASRCQPEDVERIAQPDSGHGALLYQSLLAQTGVYTQQVEFYFKGRVDVFALMRGWELLTARHESLRSLFPMPVEGEFYRVVLRKARTSLEYHDFSHLPQAEAEAEMQALLLAERQRGFDVQRGPLLRARFFRRGDGSAVMSWCFHHLLMDGWCMGVLLRELFALAGADTASASLRLPDPFPLEAYSRWRAQFDERAARAYWADLLQNFGGLTGVALPQTAEAGAAATDNTSETEFTEPQTLEFELDESLSASLQSLAKAEAVTLSALVQALWAIVLGSVNHGSRDVVFGVVTSGRPAEVAGIETAVGLFIQTLPLRARWQGNEPLGALLASVKEQSLQQMRYGYVPLAAMGRNLLDHLMVFENYPVDTRFDDGRVELCGMRGFEKIPYALGISVIPGINLSFRFLYDPVRLPEERARALRNGLHAVLVAAASGDGRTCLELEQAANNAGAGAENLGTEQTDAENAPDDATEPAVQAAAPQGADVAALAETVRAVYATVLGCSVDSVDADFFQLGGHSLIAMSLLSQLSKSLSVAVGIEDVMGYPSPRALAARIAGLVTPEAVIPRVQGRATYPLSPAQQRIWFMQKLHEGGQVYVIPFAARLRGPIDAVALQKALTLLEERHDALRLRVALEAPEQILAPVGGLRLECYDTPYADDIYLGVTMPLGAERPLVRVALYPQQDGSHVLLFCFHHIIFDGWSGEIFTRELNEAYAAALQGVAPQWRPLELDFASYALWDAQREPAVLEQVRSDLVPLPERLRLPLDFPRPALQRFEGAVLAFDLGLERSLALKDWALHAGVTVFPVLLALVDAFLLRHTGQDDVIVGCPAANREHDQVQGLVGLFVNTLVVRARMNAQAGFAELARTVDAAFGHALAAQSCPFERVIEAVGVERNAAQNPLFDVFAALEGASWSDFGREPLCMEPLPLPHQHSKFDLSFYFKERLDGGYTVDVEYCTELFTRETVSRMAERLRTLADAVLADDTKPLAELDILPAQERAEIASFNDTAESLDITADMDSRFRAQATRTPHAPAVLDAAGTAVSYAQFNAQVDAMCQWLQGQGVERGQYVCVCFERSPAMMACIFAVLRLGAVYVPLAATLPAERLRSVFEDLGPCAVVCEARFAEAFCHVGQCGQRILTPDFEALAAGAQMPCADSAREAEPLSPDSPAYVIFTSGSTGRPKGVLIEHASVANRLLWMQSRFPIGQGDVVLQKTTITFDVSVWELFWWSWQGAGIALLEPNAENNPALIVQAVEARRVTVLHFVPSMLRAFLDHLEAHPGDVLRLQFLRYVFTSGEALPRELVARWNTLTHAEPLHVELHNLYGPTEATVDVSWQPCLHTPPHVVPIGRPVSNTRLHVLDACKHPVPLGVAGEIYISGVQVARGYLNRPDLTAQRFMDDPFAPGSRMYRTGDLGRWLADGSIEYLGRNDDQVKIRGYRIELGEVEAALGRCRGVSQAIVRIGRIGEYAALEAFLLPQGDARLDLAGIRAELAALLPNYMCPARFFVVEDIPLSPSGKADRKRLQGRPLLASGEMSAPHRAQGPNTSQAGLQFAPQAGQESGISFAQIEAVREVWRQVMPEVEADPDTGFFDAGGNSLLLVRLHTLLNKQWPGIFTLAGLFSESTIRAQAAYIARSQHAGSAVEARRATTAPIAIIGMAVRLGDYADTESFWRDLAIGADMNVPMPEKRRNETRQIFDAVGLAFDEARLREAAYLSDISSFDYRRFGLSPNDASLLDPAQRVFLETALRALDDAGYGGSALESADVGVFVGASPVRLFQTAVTRAFPDLAEQTYLINVPSNVLARLSYLKNWHGPAASVDTACSSVLAALHQACRSLREGECAVALVGGAHVIDLPVKADSPFAIESASGRTKTFDAGAEGVGAGEGAAVFLLKPLDAALRDHDAIHAVIPGSAVNQDGKSSSMAAPNPDAQADVIALAAQNAGVELTDIQFFEAHGTATVLGDPVEIEGLRRAFVRQNAVRQQKALIGSVKGNLGHLDAAAGAAGLAKAVLCLEKGFVPPQPHFERPNPHIDFDAAPVRVAQTLEPLPPHERPWHCGVSSFGLSGVNTHVIVTEHMAEPLPRDDGSWQCVVFCAPDEAALHEYAGAVAEAVSRNEGWPLHAIAATLMTGRDALPVRAAVVARTRRQLLEQLATGLTSVSIGKSGLAETQRGAFFASQVEAQAAASAYLAGAVLLWPAEKPVFRLHMPATPLARTTLWPRFAAKFLLEPAVTPAGKAFALAVERPDFWPAAEHRIDGSPLLVGMGLLDCLGWIGGAAPLAITDLRWRKPVLCGPGCRVVLMARQESDAQSVEVHTSQPVNGKDEIWSVAASARVGALGALVSASAPLDLAALMAALPEVWPEVSPDVAEQGAEGNNQPHTFQTEQRLQVSARWQCRKRLWAAEDGNTLLAELHLPDAYRGDFNTFRWHPAMLDVAASLALRHASGFVPAACKEVRLYGPLTAQAWSLVRITERQPGMITADCVVADASGRALVELNGMMFMVLRHGAASVEPPELKARPQLYGLDWQNAELGPQTAGNKRIMLVGGQGGALAPSLKQALGPQVVAQGIWPVRAEDARALANEVLAADIDHLVCLPHMQGSGQENDQDQAWPLCALLQEVSRGGLRRALRVTVVGSGAFVPGESQDSLGAALHQGPLLCLPWEEPRISCAYVELEQAGNAPTSTSAASMAALAASLGHIDGPYVVAVDGSVRVRQLVSLQSAPVAAPIISGKGCVVITGGLGGMGQTLARQIYEYCGARVVLLHRSGQPTSDTLSGVPFDAYRCDITDAAQVEATFAQIRREVGSVQGVIHTAGVAGRGYLLTSRKQDYEAVLAPKVAGTWNLHRATLGDNLAFFVLASSRTALVGAPGQSDYTAANAFLNAFARYRASLGLPALSICWNTWSAVGMAAREGLGSGPEAAGMLAPQQALEVLLTALASGRENVAVGMSGENVAAYRLNGLPDKAEQTVQTVQTGQNLLTASETVTAAAPVGAGVNEHQLLEIIRDCLGYDRPLSRDDDFFDLGGDSIAATRIVNRLEKDTGLGLSVVDLLESDTLGDIVDRALALQPASESGPQPVQQPSSTVSTVVQHEQKSVPATPVLDKYPVGNEQLAILYADMVSEGDLGFNLPVFLVMPPDVDVARLEAALAQLVERHEALRTTFCDFEAERPAMIIHPFAGFALEQRHIASLAHKDEVIRPFNLRSEGGFRAILLVTDAGEKVLFIDVHHALGDGRTMSLLNAELYRLYLGLPLEPVSAQMKDIAWQQVTQPDTAAATYWQGIYGGELPQLNLPAAHPRPRVHTGRGGMYEFELAPELVQGIKALARQAGLTNYQVSLCAWSLLAQAYTGSRDVVIAVSMDSRGEHLNTAGMLASVLPLRFSIDPAQTLAAQLRATRQVSNEGMRHRGYILNSLLADLRQTTWPDRSPLSEVILSYMNFEFAAEGQGLFETLRFSKHASKTDISIFVSDTGANIGIALEYYADLFSEADMQRMASDYVRILALMTTSPADEPLCFEPSPPPVAISVASAVATASCEAATPAGLRQKVTALAAQKGARPAALLLAVFAVLMGRVGQQDQVTVGVGAGRAVAFVLDDNMDFDDLLAHTEAALAVPLFAATGQSGLRTGFEFAPSSAGGAAEPGGYGLLCSVSEQGENYLLHFVYDPRQLSAETAADWLEYYGRFIEGITEGMA